MRTCVPLLLAALFAVLVPFASRAESPAWGVSVVVVDAGHGGRFPGAHYGSVYEKELTLKVALRLGKLIEEGMPGVKVVYTRKSDKALGTDLASDLQARADIANKAGGDLFISIHVNAAKSAAARGVETLVMGESPKEQRYNTNALFESNREDLIDMSDEREAAIVRAYIQNLQFTYGEYSMALARCIQNSYLRSGRHSRGIKPQLLRVLYATDMPGVLTEIGFMSNAQEMAYMRSEKGQAEIARNLYQAVRDYSSYVLATRKGDAAEQAAGKAPEAAAKEPAGSGPDEAKGAEKRPEIPAEKAEAPAGKPAAAAGKPAAAESGKGSPEVRYAIQISASAKRVPLSSPGFGSYKGKVGEYRSEGPFGYKYCVGEYADRAAAQRELPRVRKQFPDAFVVRCRDGRIVK